MRMVQQPVDRGSGEGLRHELVEAGRVQVGGHRDGTLLVGGVDETVKAFCRERTSNVKS